MLCYASLHYEEYGHKRTRHIYKADKFKNVIYQDRNRVVKLLLHLENKQIMPNHVETQHKQMYSYYIGSLCNVAFPMARFTCNSQGFVKICMQ